MATSKLRERTLELVRNRDKTITYKVIAEQTGVTEAWLEKFSQGQIDNPGVIQIEAVYIFLSRRSLDIEAALV